MKNNHHSKTLRENTPAVYSEKEVWAASADDAVMQDRTLSCVRSSLTVCKQNTNQTEVDV